MSHAKKPPPKPEGFSAFKRFAEKIVKVPKRDVDEKEAEYQREKKEVRSRRKPA